MHVIRGGRRARVGRQSFADARVHWAWVGEPALGIFCETFGYREEIFASLWKSLEIVGEALDLLLDF